MTLEYWYVNGLLVMSREVRDQLMLMEFSQGREVRVERAPQDEHGRWVLPLNNPQEQ
jgi:hypothetical protein